MHKKTKELRKNNLNLSVKVEVLESEKNNLFRTLEEAGERIDELESQLAYECGCNAELVETQCENEQLKKRLENAVELPCKVGDTIYIPWRFTDDDEDIQSGIAHPQITSIIIREYETIISTNLEIDDCGYMEEYAEQSVSGKDKHWFLTREQAEQKLKELSNDK